MNSTATMRDYIELSAIREKATDPAIQQLFKPRLTKYIPHKPTAKQQAFLLLNCKDAFFGGAVGGGKSDALLMAALQYADCPNYAALIIRDTYANLNKPEGLLTRAHEWVQPFVASGEVKWSDKDATFTFLPHNATLSFGYLDGPRDHLNFMSAAYQCICIDEVVTIRERQAKFLFSRMRRLVGSSIPLRYRCASNPPLFDQLERGEWVKKKYVNPKTRQKDVIFIPSKMKDNPYLDAETYIEMLAHGLDPISLRQLEEGDWEIQAGETFFKTPMLQYCNSIPEDLISFYVRRWDLAASEKKRNDEADPGPAATASVKGCIYDNKFYIVDVTQDRLLPGDTDDLILRTARRDGVKTEQRCEQEGGSAGKRDMYHLSNMLKGISFVGIPSTGSKIVRARPFSSWVNQGKVYLLEGQWNKMFIDQLRAFPNGKYKDMVDAAASCFSDLTLSNVVENEYGSIPSSVGTDYADINNALYD